MRGQAAFLELASMPEIAELAGACLGTENVILWACQIFCKPAGTGKSVPWHQDGQYWPIEPLRAVTAWIALDRSDEECGARRLVPGTHAAEPVLIPHVQRIDPGAAISYVADPALLDEALLASAATLTLEPGQLSLHDAMVLHGSGGNTSARRRAGVAATFMPAECHFYRDRPTEGALSRAASSWTSRRGRSLWSRGATSTQRTRSCTTSWQLGGRKRGETVRLA